MAKCEQGFPSERSLAEVVADRLRAEDELILALYAPDGSHSVTPTGELSPQETAALQAQREFETLERDW